MEDKWVEKWGALCLVLLVPPFALLRFTEGREGAGYRFADVIIWILIVLCFATWSNFAVGIFVIVAAFGLVFGGLIAILIYLIKLIIKLIHPA